MRIKLFVPLIGILATLSWATLRAGDEAKPAEAATESAEIAKARAEFEAAQKASVEAQAAIGPLRDSMRKADTAYAEANKIATAARQKANDAKNLAGEPGVKDLAQAEAAVPEAVKALAEAAEAKPPLDKTLEEARAVAAPLQAAYDAAEKAAKEAEAAAKVAADAANRLTDDAKKATEQAAALRKAADSAKASLERAQKGEQTAAEKAEAAPQKIVEAEAQKKAADEALAASESQLAAATAANEAAQQAVQAADAQVKEVAKEGSDEQKQQAAADVAAKHKLAAEAKAALAKTQSAHQAAQKAIGAASQAVARAATQKKTADAALEAARKQITAATNAVESAEQAAVAAEKAAEEKNQAVAQADAKRKAAAAAAAQLAQAQQAEQQAQAPVDAAAQKVAEAQAARKTADDAWTAAKNQVTAATAALQAADEAAQAAEAAAKQVADDAGKSDEEKKQAADEAAAKRKAAEDAKAALAQSQSGEQAAQAAASAAAQKATEAEAAKKTADEALAAAKNQTATVVTATQAALDAAKDIMQLDAAHQQTAADAAAKRKAANEAKTALAPAAQKLEQAAVQATNAAQTLERAEARKKSAEEGLENLKKRIAAAKESHEADEKAAQEAEAAAVPVKEEADRTRAAYMAGMTAADEARTKAQQTKAALYRLVASERIASVVDSSETPKPANRIDEIVFAKLKTLNIEPTRCADAVFVRRVYLDITGTIPPAGIAKTFILDTAPNKRAALIDSLLEQTSHADYWAMKWSDILRIKAEFPVTLWPNAAQAYYRWVWESLAKNKPYDQFARELLTSSGSNFRVGAVNFYRAIQDETPENIAGAVALTFMSTRIHLWPEERRTGMAAFFSQVGYKPTSEWKEEIVFWDPLKSSAVPGSVAPGIDAIAKAVTATNQIPQGLAEPISRNGPLTAAFPDGTQVTVPPDRDPREVFADWLIRPENPWFARAIANRTWAWIMGRGIVQEADDFRDDNPPSNPELLDYLASELVSSGWDIKHLQRLIFNSSTYQFSSIARHHEPEAIANFASYPLRRIEAEVLIDALNNITGATDLYTSAVPEPFTYIPSSMRAVGLADGSITSSFLALFGRSGRDTGLEAERISQMATPQWLYMLNAAAIQNKLQSSSTLTALISAGGQPRDILERIYLAILSRFPTEEDIKAATEHADSGASKGRDVWVDLAWALINSPEFLLRH